MPYDGGESTSKPPDSPHQTTSSTTATVPRRSIANRHVKRRLHMCANRKLHSSKLFRRSGPTYTPYHMMVESRPLYLLICLIKTLLRLQRRYHADPLLKYAAIVVCICMPSAYQAVASSFADQDQPTHHTNMMAESRRYSKVCWLNTAVFLSYAHTLSLHDALPISKELATA